MRPVLNRRTFVHVTNFWNGPQHYPLLHVFWSFSTAGFSVSCYSAGSFFSMCAALVSPQVSETILGKISLSISGSILWIISGIIFGQISIILLCYIFVIEAKYYRAIGRCKNRTKRSQILKPLVCLFHFSTYIIEESIQLYS